MTRVWRMCRAIHAAFDGEGARLAGGRWTPRGVAAVYTGSSLALTALEYFVHLDFEFAPVDLVAVPAEIPPQVRIETVSASTLPANWRAITWPPALSAIGAAWVRASKTTVLRVPSAVIPAESNYILNPAHPDFKRITIGKPQAFTYDPRMWKKPSR